MPDKDRQFGQNEQKDWAETLAQDHPDGYQRFLNLYPSSQFMPKALERLDYWEEEEAFNHAVQADSLQAYNHFVLNYPRSDYKAQVQERIYQLEKELALRYKLLADEVVAWQSAEKDHTLYTYRSFLRSYPSGKFEEMAKQRIQMLELRQEEQQAFVHPDRLIPANLDRIRLAETTHIFESENLRNRRTAIILSLIWLVGSVLLAGLTYFIADFIFPLSMLLGMGVGLFLLLQRDAYLSQTESLIYLLGEGVASFFLLFVSARLLGAEIAVASFLGTFCLLIVLFVLGRYIWERRKN
ncbi:MAG: hypothetical protein AAF927_24660 [Bacteroidota bacterium]